MEKRKFPEPQPVSTKPRPAIPLHEVKSSQIARVGHDAATNTLAVQFHRGTAIYHYPGVSTEQHHAFVNAESIGTHFGKHIKHLPFEKFALDVHHQHQA